MPRSTTVALVATALVLSALMIQILVALERTGGGTDVWSNASQTAGMPVHELHVQHPDMKTLPVHDAPQP